MSEFTNFERAEKALHEFSIRMSGSAAENKGIFVEIMVRELNSLYESTVGECSKWLESVGATKDESDPYHDILYYLAAQLRFELLPHKKWVVNLPTKKEVS